MKKAIIILILLITLVGCKPAEIKTIKGVVTDVEVTTLTHWLSGRSVITKITFENGTTKYFLDSLPDEVKRGRVNVIHFKRIYTGSGFTDKIYGPIEFPEGSK